MAKKGKTIAMSSHVEEYANELIPIVDNIIKYVNAHVEIHETWKTYKGNGRKEFDDYEDASNQQVTIVATNYNVLRNILTNIVIAFLELDEEAGKKILGFYCRNYPETIAAMEAEDPNLTAAREYYGV